MYQGTETTGKDERMERAEVDAVKERVEVGDNWAKGRGSIGAQVQTNQDAQAVEAHGATEFIMRRARNCLQSQRVQLEVKAQGLEANALLTTGLSLTSTGDFFDICDDERRRTTGNQGYIYILLLIFAMTVLMLNLDYRICRRKGWRSRAATKTKKQIATK